MYGSYRVICINIISFDDYDKRSFQLSKRKLIHRCKRSSIARG